ncbi:hypothetical protein L1D15_02380 [Vibrio sp. Isolate25]|uniref:hypothetical protein n=1 Tax=Vibrio sp. Isolate25 TaxID=2908535 RepID=UPI001EFE5200|nr:hypothetical protein [Vibrio sp. Isolate25]MCG9595563.1 hypothetical protein [Vibrio sp. Isolate25]
MQLICKFVPGNSVSRDVLDYILSPDECIGQLSRTRNLQDMLRQLPKPLSDTLPQSAKKDTHSLLSSIKQRLVRAEWVALSSFARRTPLSDAQLEAYPALKMRVDQFAAEQPKKIIKANYKAVTDDVPLARNLSYTPVEPSPDKKIVIEFAGQWPSNAAYLILSATDNQKEKIAKPRKDSSKSHRSVAVFKGLEAEPRNLYLAIPISGSTTPLKLLLTENVEPVDASDEMDEWDNVLVPILPVLNGDDTSEMLDSGYFYVVWNNKVWRELEVTSKSYFADVDIDFYRNQEPVTAKRLRHVDIDGGTLIEDYYVGEEPFEVIQDGKSVYQGELSTDQTARVFGLTDEEVEVVFTDLDLEPLTLMTKESPFKAGSITERISQGVPLPHIWVPYKVAGEVQSECYLHYSAERLTLTQLSELESDPASIAEPLTDLEMYSSNQSFDNAGDLVLAVPKTSTQAASGALVNSQNSCNIAAVKMTPKGALPYLRYLYEEGVDQEDDFFALRCRENEWMSKSFMRAAQLDDEGYKTFYFSFPPPEVEKVDLVRGAHSNPGAGTQHLIVMEEGIPVSKLLG